jgi:hypothetical protein
MKNEAFQNESNSLKILMSAAGRYLIFIQSAPAVGESVFVENN